MPYIFGKEQVPACRESGLDKPGKAQRTVLSGMEGQKHGGQVPAVRTGDLARERHFAER
jgi:hypothetical protein